MAKNHDHSTEIVCETENGRVLQCKSCTDFCLEFGNLLLRFDDEQVQRFKQTIDAYDIDYFEQANTHLELRRSLVIGLRNGSTMMVFTADEIYELRTLLDQATNYMQSAELHTLYQDIEDWLN